MYRCRALPALGTRPEMPRARFLRLRTVGTYGTYGTVGTAVGLERETY